MVEQFGTSEWCELLAETRHALSTLRAEDLKGLAARAQRVLDANPRFDPQKLGQTDLAKLIRERRLLGDLMLATDRNLSVLRQLRQRTRRNPQAEGMGQPWAR